MPYLVRAHPDAYGKQVLIAWEFSPDVFMDILSKAVNGMDQQKIKYDLLHEEKPTTDSRKLWKGTRGNDWSHVSILMMDRFKKKDEKVLETLAKRHTPAWTPQNYVFWNANDGKNVIVALKLDYPPEAVAFEKEWRKYTGDRASPISGANKREFIPHATLFAVEAQDKEAVENIMKGIKFPTGKIPTHAIQVWNDYHVVDHILV